MAKIEEMKRVKLNKLKLGDYFKLNPTETAPVWVRGEYDRMCKRYDCYRFDDVNHENFMKGDRNVYIDFEF